MSGDGSFVAFQSQAVLTVDDLNETAARYGTIRITDVYGYDVAAGTVERLSQPLPEGSEATGCRPEGSTGILGPMTNGGDPTIGVDRTYVAFGSNGDLAAERPARFVDALREAAEECTRPTVDLLALPARHRLMPCRRPLTSRPPATPTTCRPWPPSSSRTVRSASWSRCR